MIAHTSQFKEELFKFGRQYKNKIGIYDDDILITEGADLIITEDGNNLVAKTSDSTIKYEIDDTNIYSIKIITKGELLSTLMKELDFESDLNFEVGTAINYKFGIKIENSYEYLDYGKFIIYKKEYQNDTKTYFYTCYDTMLKTMIKIGDEFNFDTIPTGDDVLTKICNNVGIYFDNSLIEQDNITPTPYGMIKSLNYSINISAIKEANITYRDLLNILCQYFGVSMLMVNNELKIKLLGDIVNDNGTWVVDNENVTSVDTFDEQPFKDKNVAFKEKYGRINALNISGLDGSKTVYLQDNQSVTDDGMTLFEIKDNLLLNDETYWQTYSQNIAENVFDMINGVSFNLCDFSSYGIMYLEWLDYYTVNINNNTYKALLLNSEITIKSGINEDIYTQQPEKNTTEYTTTEKSTDIIADTLRAKGNAYANGYKLVQENEINVYSIKENKIGTWTNGKSIYQKIVNFVAPATANTDVLLVNNLLEDFDFLINIYGNYYKGVTNWALNTYHSSNFFNSVYYNNNTNELRGSFGSSLTNGYGCVIIEYTKINN